MILFLDDSPERAKVFLATYPEARWVETAQACIMALATGHYTDVCLDHDLGGESHVSSDRADCGMEVVRWVMRHRPNVGRFIVHSWNEPAGRRMEHTLRLGGYSAIYAPFGLVPWGQPSESA